MLKVCAGFAGTTTKVYALGNGKADFVKKFMRMSWYSHESHEF